MLAVDAVASEPVSAKHLLTGNGGHTETRLHFLQPQPQPGHVFCPSWPQLPDGPDPERKSFHAKCTV